MKKKILIAAILMVMMVITLGCSQNTADTEILETKNEITDENAEQTVQTDDTDNSESDEVVIKDDEKYTMSIGTLSGPTGMGMAQLIDQTEMGMNQLDATFTISTNPSEMVGKIVSGELNIACVPSNLASVLYNKTKGNVQVLGVNTLGVLYLVENGETIENVQSLEGKTIYVGNAGSLPEYVLNYIIENNGVENVTLDFSLSHNDIAAQMAAGDIELALLPQPHATTATMKNEKAKIVLDINEEWAKLNEQNTELPMGVVVVNKGYAMENPEAVETFMKAYGESVAFTNDDYDKASDLIVKHNILPKKEIAYEALPYCNIVWYSDGQEIDLLKSLYDVLFAYNPKSIGGNIPNDDFYYSEKGQEN